MTNDTTPDLPTAQSLSKLVKRQQGLMREQTQLQDDVDGLDGAISTGLADGNDVEQCTAARRKQRDRLDDLRRALPDLADRIDRETYTVATAEAKRRLIGLHRASGSLIDLLETEGQQLCDDARGLHQRVVAYITRWNKLIGNDRADSALAHRFDLPQAPRSELGLKPPANHESIIEFVRLLERMIDVFPTKVYHHKMSHEQDEHGLRRRRDYLETTDHETKKILVLAGLKDFPPLTAKQEKAIAARKASQAVEKKVAAQFADEIKDSEQAQAQVDTLQNSPLYQRAARGPSSS